MIKKVLIANRGEIALRIIRACKELGIKTVTVHSQADENSLHRKFADEDVCIGPATPDESYLNMKNLMAAVEITQADAIHPGYGFLAENPKFAQICHDQDIKFIGPSAKIIQMMGDKATARETMIKAGVPVTPGTKIIENIEHAIIEAKKLEYPVLIKASAGGGGKGMRIAQNEQELRSQLPLAMAEAEKAFGNDDVYLEKYLKNPKHIEIQILSDKYGNHLYLGERDCSIQRRHQKLIEEAPSPVITDQIRKQMGEAAVKGAEAVGYENAGTVEFLLEDGKFYFMEMNTRIQVEHPVTEMITHKDLIKEQVRIANNEEIRFKQDEIMIYGNSIECRINAENPEKGFVPTPGRIESLHIPSGFGVRVDSHIYSGYEVPTNYDSLLAKLIVWGEDREKAILRMKRCLEEMVIEGIHTTIPFHLKVMNDKRFLEGNYTTKFIEDFQM